LKQKYRFIKFKNKSLYDRLNSVLSNNTICRGSSLGHVMCYLGFIFEACL